jgi:hypothetical protein
VGPGSKDESERGGLNIGIERRRGEWGWWVTSAVLEAEVRRMELQKFA